MTTYDVGDGDDLDLEPRELKKIQYQVKNNPTGRSVTLYMDREVEIEASAILSSLGIDHKAFKLGMITAQWTALGVLEEFYELVEYVESEPEDYSRSEIEEDE